MKHYRDGMFEINKSRADLNARIGKANAGAGQASRARRWVLSMSMCAAIALFAVISVHYVRLNSWSEYTASDETVRYVLPDSSVAVLAPGSELRLQKRKNIRHMEMSGKIFFNVAHDSAHPFTISVSRGLPVTVLGTRFQVDQSDSLTRVDVLDGKVSFGRMTLTKGMSASYRPETGLLEMTSGDVLNPMAWATGCFVYDDSALDEVIKDLEFFYHVKINVSGSVDGKKLTGTFPTADLSSVLELIGMACGVELTKFP